jgi:hypothetical protein
MILHLWHALVLQDPKHLQSDCTARGKKLEIDVGAIFVKRNVKCSISGKEQPLCLTNHVEILQATKLVTRYLRILVDTSYNI